MITAKHFTTILSRSRSLLGAIEEAVPGARLQGRFLMPVQVDYKHRYQDVDCFLATHCNIPYEVARWAITNESYYESKEKFAEAVLTAVQVANEEGLANSLQVV